MYKILFSMFFLAVFFACNNGKECEEHPKSDCVCTLQYDPVCGCNGKTYGNACAAACAGIDSFVPGECGQKNGGDLEGSWKLTVIVAGSETMQVPESVPAVVKLSKGVLAGNGGCNSIGGKYEAAGNKLSVSNLISTKKACDPESKWENLFLERLRESETYQVADNILHIQSGDLGTLTLKKQ